MCRSECLRASCHSHPDAVCVADPCNDCRVSFYRWVFGWWVVGRGEGGGFVVVVVNGTFVLMIVVVVDLSFFTLLSWSLVSFYLGLIFIITIPVITFRVRHILPGSPFLLAALPLPLFSLTLAPSRPHLLSSSLSASGEKVHCEGRCSQPLAKGMCRASFKRFFYNASADQCQEFIFGGCLGNDNNFVSMEECQQECQNTGKGSWVCLSCLFITIGL